jgi:alpha-L-fucosidase
MTMNDHWGFNAADANWKSTKDLVRNLIDIASKGGNYLLNVGPRADDTFPPEAIERLQQIGAWMKVNGEAIHGTTASVFDAEPWCRWTVKRTGDLTKLYLHVFEPPADGHIVLAQLGSKVQRAYPLARPDQELLQHGTGNWGDQRQIFLLTEENDIAPVLVFEVRGEPIVYRAPAIDADGDAFVTGTSVRIAPRGTDAPVHFTIDGSEPTLTSPRAKGPLALTATTTVKARAVYGKTGLPGGPVPGPIAERTFTKLEPLPAVKALAPNAGLRVERFAGDWKAIPADLETRTPGASTTAAAVALPANVGERVLLSFRGFVDVPADDLYRFELTSDDGSKLWVDGKLVIDNDGLHGPVTKEGAIALAKGLHAIHVAWFNRTGDVALGLKWATPGQPFTPLPANALRH